MKRTAFVLGALLWAAAAVAGGAGEHAIPAGQLAAEYSRNEIAADAKYQGKTIVVTGAVQDIGIDIFGNPYLSMGGSGGLDGLQCTFSKASKPALAKLSKGQVVTVSGVVSGKTIGIVGIDRAKLVKTH